ncbi:P-loop NTPase fold protein [Rhodopseudomonas palustris]|uniref:KAP NTPase domain-containing protein n=1 Tax=Rhodopseudomonas palustris (strain BisB18) TaxID=316056 RepID=Q20ZH8_RHOPB
MARQTTTNATSNWSSPTWDLVEGDALEIRFIEERSSGTTDALTLFGQQAALNTIKSALLGTLEGGGRRRQASILALLGRFGQGKTRILSQLFDWLDGKSTISGGLRYPRRVRIFKISEYPQQDVAAAFDAFIARKHLLSRSIIGLGLATLVATCATFFIISVGLVLEYSVGTTFVSKLVDFTAAKTVFSAVLAASTVLFCGVSVWAFWRKEVELRANFLDVRSLCRLIVETFQSSDVLLIDDFDRATSEQQIAMLWTLRRRRDELQVSVIVAFDESPLLRGEQGALAQELLEKTFDVAVRLNPITRYDSIQMAMGFTSHLFRLNPCIPAAKLLCDPIVVSDLARIFLLMGRASARFAKGFLNRALASIHQLGLQVPDDVCGLIRLQGLYEIVPWIENDAERLGDILSRNDAEALLTYVEKRRGSILQGNIRESVKAYVEGTRRLQPSLGNWDRVLAIWTGAQSSDVNKSIQTRRLGSCFYDEWLDEAGELAEGRRRNMLSNWLSWDLALLLESRPIERRTVYALCRTMKCRPVDPAFAGPAEWLANEPPQSVSPIEQLLWLFLLDRTRIADVELPSDEMRSLAFPTDVAGDDLPEYIREEALNAWRRLPLIHPHAPLSLPERVELACSALPDRGMGPAITRLFNQNRNVAPDSFDLPADRRVFGIRSNELKHMERRSFLERHWPTFSDEEAAQHFRALAVLAPWRAIAPRAHRLWLFEQARVGAPELLFRSLLKLLPHTGGVQNWPLGVVRPLLCGRPDDEFAASDYRGVSAALAEQAAVLNRTDVVRMLFLLANTDEHEALQTVLSYQAPSKLDDGWIAAVGAIRLESSAFSAMFDRSSWRPVVDDYFRRTLNEAETDILTSEDDVVRSQALSNLDSLRTTANVWQLNATAP